MENYILPHFGYIHPNNIEDYYSAEITYHDNKIQFDINFDETTTDFITLDKIKNVIERLEKFEEKNKRYILHDFHNENGETVSSYIEHHLEEIDESTLSKLIDFTDSSKSREEQLVDQLKLIRVGIYPNYAEHFITFDYSLGENITPYLVVINTKENGNLCEILMES